MTPPANEEDRRLCHDRRKECPHAAEAADMAVKKVFAILGVDIDQPQQVEEFRKSLRWSDDMRRKADKGVMVVITVVIAALAGAVLAKFGIKGP